MSYHGLVSWVILAAIASAGCVTAPVSPNTTSDSVSASAAPPKKANQTFDGSTIPAGWIAHRGTWSVKNGSTANRGLLEGRGDAEAGLSSLVDHADGAYTDFTLEVDFVMLSGEHPQGAGVVFDWKDAENYQIIRYSISEQGWHLFTVVDGNRNKQDDATRDDTTAPEFDQWVHLKVVQAEGMVTAFDGDTMVLEYELKNQDSPSGLVGAFCRGNTVARFDNVTMDPSGA